MKCSICLDEIYLFAYKSNCKCNLYYHYDCIEEWYKYNKCCIICKKKDNRNIQYIKSKLYETTTLYIYIFFSIMCYYFLIL